MNRIEFLKSLGDRDCASAVAAFAIGMMHSEMGLPDSLVLQNVQSLRAELLEDMTDS